MLRQQQCPTDHCSLPSLCLGGICRLTSTLPLARPQLGQLEGAALSSLSNRLRAVMPLVAILIGPAVACLKGWVTACACLLLYVV